MKSFVGRHTALAARMCVCADFEATLVVPVFGKYLAALEVITLRTLYIKVGIAASCSFDAKTYSNKLAKASANAIAAHMGNVTIQPK